MSRDLSCPRCSETEELGGTRGPEGIIITCDSCGHSWPRDVGAASCATCGGDQLVTCPQATREYSRGTQMSVVAWREISLCVNCDETMLGKANTGKAVPGDYRPAAAERRTADGQTTPQ